MMTPVQWYVIFIISIPVMLFSRYAFVRWRLQRAMNRPTPDAWVAILKKNFPIFPYLSESQVAKLINLIKRFLHQKKFVGCSGLEMTTEIQVTIAAGACLLILNHRRDPYSKLGWIYVYPSAFIAHRETANALGVVSKERVGLLGESWSSGKVILSWDDVAKGVRNFTDGHNVLLHEFAHQLDTEDGSANGAPILRQGQAYASWAAVLSKEFLSLQKDVSRRRKDVIDSYGATNPAEFFAVATETFFEQPEKLKCEHPQLFEELLSYYQLDPSEWAS